ncbi:ATP-dependent protease ClpP protease subunit [Mangrovibacterium marinum]|uniref:ATP-dependent Clp protease proteolytic subunit n=1 Tax=Mangrovibacterium marinum TaxID=1639118 RepID=A0A2T5C0H0_9BACT|nr:Clp protease ClpP [Mangrovibacterium marinum]PTN08048.1 ATP-dependent protease ClpP protease subunit [Mangrovibacterium marinum]
MEQRYSKIVNREKKQVEILLYGILGDNWEDGEIDGNYFARELNWLGREYDEITIRINSWGGNLDMGLSIVSEIRASKAFIITKVDGVAASMSGIIAVAGDRSEMNDYARLMLHLAYYIDGDGNKISDLNPRDQKALDQMNGILTDILARKGKSKDEIAAILDAETWYDADEAVAEGFIDQKIDTSNKKLAALDPRKLVAAVMDDFKPTNTKRSMERIAAKFGLSKDATEEQVLAKIQEEETASATKMVDQLIVVAKSIGTVSDELKNEEKARRVAKADAELFADLYLKVEKPEAGEGGKAKMIKDLVKTGDAGKHETKIVDKKFDELSEKELDDLRDKDRKTYVAKFKAHYGFEPEIED